jgi:hypothetical protein
LSETERPSLERTRRFGQPGGTVIFDSSKIRMMTFFKRVKNESLERLVEVANAGAETATKIDKARA